MEISSNLKRVFCAFVLFACAWILFMPAVLSLAGCSEAKDTKNKDYINYISFSYDGKKILFDRQKGEGPYMINVYDLETCELSAYQSPPDEQWTMARYSYDGKYIVFVVCPRKNNKLDQNNMQLAIMEPDGKNIKKITKTDKPKIFPSFSHAGDKIIFAKAGTIRKSGRTPVADFDFYELNIETGVETRLTWFEFYSVSYPYLFPDDETIIFGALAPRGSKIYDDNIYVIKKEEKLLPRPLIILDEISNPLISKLSGTKRPLISRDGKHIFFQCRAKKPDGVYGDGDQYYEYARDGKYRRVTYITPPSSSIYSSALSHDGRYLAIVYCSVSKSNESRKLVIYHVKDCTSRTITLLDQPSRIINQHL